MLWKLYCWNNTARLLTKFYVEFMPSASDSFVRHQSAAFDHFRVIFTHNSLSRILLESRQYSKKLHERYNLSTILTTPFPAGIYQLKVINRNIRKRCEICSKLTIKTPERRQHHWCRSGVFNVNFEHIPHLVLVFLWLTLNM